jgi:hypothetical protein
MLAIQISSLCKIIVTSLWVSSISLYLRQRYHPNEGEFPISSEKRQAATTASKVCHPDNNGKRHVLTLESNE